MSLRSSCEECRRRKIRCDREDPCGYCQKVKIRCVYAIGSESRNRSQPPHRPRVEPESSARTQQHEGYVPRLEARPSFTPELGQVTTGGGFPSWPGEPSTSYAQLFGPSTSTSLSAHDAAPLQSTLQPTLLDDVSLRQLRVDSAQLIWQVYLTDIDPFMKIVDQQCVEEALVQYPNGSADGMVLFHAVFFATMVCKYPTFAVDYHRRAKALESHLLSTNIFSNPTLPLLQAFAIYLTCGTENMDRAYLCSMLSQLIRLAIGLQLNCDPEALNCSPSECEYRRRLWWYIVSLDLRTAETSDGIPMVGPQYMSVKMPCMVSDITLRSAGLVVPTTHSPCMFFAIVSFEAAKIARQALYSFDYDTATENRDNSRKVALVNELHQVLHNRYLRYCDCTNSRVCYITTQWCYIYWARLRLRVLHPKKVLLQDVSDNSTPNNDRDLLTCVDVLERVKILKTDARYSSWAWLWHRNMEWDLIAIAMCMIGAGTCPDEFVDRAWSAIDSVFASGDGSFGDPAHRQRWRELEIFRDWVRATQAGKGKSRRA